MSTYNQCDGQCDEGTCDLCSGNFSIRPARERDCRTDPCGVCQRRNAVLASQEWADACDAAKLIGFDIHQVEGESDSAFHHFKVGVQQALDDAETATRALKALVAKIDRSTQ